MITTLNLQEAKKLLAQKSYPVIVQAQNEQFNRAILEHHFDVLLLALNSKESSLKSQHLGISLTAAKNAAKSNVALGIDLAGLRTLQPSAKAQALMQLRELLSLSKKTKSRVALLNVRNEQTARGLLLALGATTEQAAQALTF